MNNNKNHAVSRILAKGYLKSVLLRLSKIAIALVLDPKKDTTFEGSNTHLMSF